MRLRLTILIVIIISVIILLSFFKKEENTDEEISISKTDFNKTDFLITLPDTLNNPFSEEKKRPKLPKLIKKIKKTEPELLNLNVKGIIKTEIGYEAMIFDDSKNGFIFLGKDSLYKNMVITDVNPEFISYKVVDDSVTNRINLIDTAKIKIEKN